MRVLKPGFHQQVYRLVRAIPRGEVRSYGEIARALGAVQVARHVGFALAALRDESIPWHRVINSRGRISFPVGSERFETQRTLLRAEGLSVDDEGRVS